MDQNDLDREMNALMEKLAKRPAVGSEPYRSDPLSSDHFILTRSWEFFKKRIAAIEKQWQDIVNAKAEENRVLKKELEMRQSRLHELEEGKLSLEEMLANFKMSRLQDFEEFKKKNEKLKMAWEEERVTLESKLMNLEVQVEREKKKAEEETGRVQVKLTQAHRRIEELRAENQRLLEDQAVIHQNLQKIMLEKDESLSGSESKVDLLRREVDRRDRIIHELDATIQSADQKTRGDQSDQSALKETLEIKIREIQTLHDQFEQLRKEKSTLLENWDREKAEWRELWDRAREVWEKKKA